MKFFRFSALTALAPAAILWATPAQAQRYELDLSTFGGAGGTDEAGFQSLVGDLALAMHPKFAGPGSTVGGLGIDIAYGIALVDIDETKDYWNDAVGEPGGALQVSHLHVRKGLPYSFELGGVVSHLHESDIWGVGLELKWAFIEGNHQAPDFGFRTHINTVLGDRDLVLLTSGGDLMLSWTFGIGGLVQTTPYAGYELTYVHAKSHVLGAFAEGALQPSTFILPTQDFLRHRAVVGLRVVAGIADFGFEAGLGELQSYTFKVGLSL